MDMQEQCRGCIYYRPISATGNAHCGRCCHYYLDTLQRRTEKDGVCLCHTTLEDLVNQKVKKKVKKKVKVFT